MTSILTTGGIIHKGFTLKSQKMMMFILFAALLPTGCNRRENYQDNDLVGAWRGKVQFKSGSFAGMKDLEFMYVFNAGGTMTESSNYDGAPPVPPAYGIWRKTGPRQFEARYEFYSTKAPSLDDLSKGRGWMPAGHGVLMEKITQVAG